MQDTRPKTLDIQGLTKTFRVPGGGTARAVREFTLHVAPGEFVTLLGPSGCGKTTVLRMIAGLEEADGGAIRLDGDDITRLPAHRRRVGMVFQNYALFPHLTVFENVAYSFRIRRARDAEVGPAVAAALRAVDLEHLAARLPAQLSGGQQQRVALARAFVMRPDLLLFDEPLSNLDAKLRLSVRAELRRLQRSFGATTLYVTHDQDEAMGLSDRIVVMRDGVIEQVGTPDEVYARPASHFVADFVGRVNTLPGRVVGRSGHTAIVQALGRTVEVRADQCPATDVLLLLRPESVRLQPCAGGLAGVVEDVEFRGDRLEYRVRVGSHAVIAVETAEPGRARRRLGEQVDIAWPQDALHVLPADSQRPADPAQPVEAGPGAPGTIAAARA